MGPWWCTSVVTAVLPRQERDLQVACSPLSAQEVEEAFRFCKCASFFLVFTQTPWLFRLMYQVIAALKCDRFSQISLAKSFLIRGIWQVLPRWAQALNIQMRSESCKTTLCPDRPYLVSGDEQRNAFWPELAKLPPQLWGPMTHSENRIYLLDGANVVPQSTGICIVWEYTSKVTLRGNHWTVEQTSLLRTFKDNTAKVLKWYETVVCKSIFWHWRDTGALWSDWRTCLLQSSSIHCFQLKFNLVYPSSSKRKFKI